jgi:hypothetical protein
MKSVLLAGVAKRNQGRCAVAPRFRLSAGHNTSGAAIWARQGVRVLDSRARWPGGGRWRALRCDEAGRIEAAASYGVTMAGAGAVYQTADRRKRGGRAAPSC